MKNFIKFYFATIAMIVLSINAFAQMADVCTINERPNLSLISTIGGAATSSSANATEHTQIKTWYRVSNNAHGYAAEDANALDDRMAGKRVKQTGSTNQSDGPDRIVNGEEIQTKYCKTASHTIETSFDKQTGKYRYPGQRLEVPKEQYKEAIKLMEQKIKEGRVYDKHGNLITDPSEAKKIIKMGRYTYEQARKIAEPGNIESIKFDIKTGAITCTYAAGISFVICYISAISNGMSEKEAATYAAKEAGISAATVMVAHVSTQQVLRMDPAANLIGKSDNLSSKIIGKICDTETGKKIVEKTVSGMSGKELTGTAARRAAERMMSCTLVSSAITTSVVTIPSVVQGCNGSKDWGEVGKDAAVNVTGVAGGAAGSWAGAAIGTAIAPGIGTVVGGFIGGVAAGAGTSFGTRKLVDLIGGDKKGNKNDNLK